MALPKILNDLRVDERNYIVGKMDRNPLAGVDATSYGDAMQTSFILSVLEKIDSTKFAGATSQIEFQNISNRSSQLSMFLEISKSSQVGISIGIAYQGGLNTIKTIRKVGTNLTLINVSKDVFADDKVSFTTQIGITYSLSGGSWSGGEELVLFMKDGSLFVADSSSVNLVS